MSPIERETKLVVSRADYLRLRETGRLLEERDQLNVYFHDPARLTDEVGYFRVRFERGREPMASIKIPAGWKGEMREMVEVERPLTDLGPGLFPRPGRWVMVDADVPEGFMDHFRALGIERLRRLGWMRNHRSLVELPGLGSIELDLTVLPGGELHFEVEVENPVEEIHRSLVERIRELAPSATYSRTGKFTRFLVASGLGPSSSANPL